MRVTLTALALTVATFAAWAQTPLLHLNGRNQLVDGAGHAPYLSGSHNWYSIQDQREVDGAPTQWTNGFPQQITNFLGFLTARGYTFTRLWINSAPGIDMSTNVNAAPFLRTGPGTDIGTGLLKFDLTQTNPVWFSTLSARCGDLDRNNIYFTIMANGGAEALWVQYGNHYLTNSPWFTSNNINGGWLGTNDILTSATAAATAFTNFFFRLIDVGSLYPHCVGIEVVNEAPGQSSNFIASVCSAGTNYIATNSAVANKILVGMSCYLDVGGGHQGNDSLTNQTVFSFIAPYQPNNNSGNVGSNSPPTVQSWTANPNQLVFMDTDHNTARPFSNTIGAAFMWPAESLLMGYHHINMDGSLTYTNGSPQIPDALRDPWRATTTDVINYAHRIQLETATPSTTVSGTGFALTNTLLQYLVFAPTKSAFNVALPAGKYYSECWDAQSRSVVDKRAISNAASGNYNFQIPSAVSTQSMWYIAPYVSMGGLDFDGTSNAVNAGTVSTTLLTNSITIMAWVFPRDKSKNQRIADDAGAGNGWNYYLTTTGTDAAEFDDGGGSSSSANNSVPTNTWTHVAVTVTGAGVANHYINGVLNGPANQALGNRFNTASTVWVGNNNAFSRGFNGLIRDFRFYNAVLTAARIQAIYQSRASYFPDTASLKIYYPFDDKGDGVSANNVTIPDRSIGGNTGHGTNGNDATALTFRAGNLLRRWQ